MIEHFLKKYSDDTIYMNDLGALGSFEMKRISASIYEFINYAREHYDEMLDLLPDELKIDKEQLLNLFDELRNF